MSHSHPESTPRVIPAQVNFLTIYNPSLGDTEETEREQIVFWTSRKDLLRTHRRNRSGAASSLGPKERDQGAQQEGHDDLRSSKSQDEKFNFRLRQIGLAQGMVEFVKNFSPNTTVDSIDAEKSRIILHELESGWWILASIDLTRLPASALSSSTNNSSTQGKSTASAADGKGSGPSHQYEYSAREVAPPQLLLTQILRAHRIFLLHHAASLWDIYHKVGRPNFCSLLERYWERFVWDWDVLLHGSPAVEIYGCCTKLAGGGELGMGVGEEEWGSGEREVLEGFVERTEGLVDLIVGRYGEGPARTTREKSPTTPEYDEESRGDPWPGSGEDPGPADGIVFSGTGRLSRKSLATVSQWMEAIFKHGQGAYGVGENPSARPRPKRKTTQRPKATRKVSEDPKSPIRTKEDEEHTESADVHPRHRSTRGRAPDLRRKAMENNASPPGIPAPLVGAVERSLDEALARAANRSSSRSPKSSPKQEKSEGEAMKSNGFDTAPSNQESNVSNSSLFGSESMMKVLTLGYGSSWTLNPKGLKDTTAGSTEPGKTDVTKTSDTTNNSNQSSATKPRIVRTTSKSAEERLQELDPTPSISDEEDTGQHAGTPFVQRLEKSVGKFVIGLSGDLENTDFEDDGDEDETTDSEVSKASYQQRIYLRTLTVEVDYPKRPLSLVSAGRTASRESFHSNRSGGSDTARPIPKTSAAASVDGPSPHKVHHEKVQIAVYTHQPFIFVFLFTLHTASLTMPGFYRNIHHQLGPLQSLLLKRTDAERVAERIKDVIMSKDGNASASTLAKAAAAGNVVFDLVYDPSKLTVRTSIPNIPIPASSSNNDTSPTKTTTVSGSWYTLGIPISSPSVSSTASSSPSRTLSPRNTKFDRSARQRVAEQWTRIEALNVHSQILNSWIATRDAPIFESANMNADITKPSMTGEMERTVKTNRGWWVLWMKVPVVSVRQPQPQVQSQDQHLNQGQVLDPRLSISTSSSTITQTALSSSYLDNKRHVKVRAKEAFLVRKAAEYANSSTGKLSATKSAGSSLGSGGRWLLREQSRETSRGNGDYTSGTGDGDGAGARSISEGVGIDAKKWVEGLLHLSL